MSYHRRGMCPECSRIVATTAEGRVWRHDHIARRGTIVCPGKGRPAVDIMPRQLEIPAEQLRLVDLVNEDGDIIAFAVSLDDNTDAEVLEAEGLFVA